MNTKPDFRVPHLPLPHLEKAPQIHPSVHVDPTARVFGDVTVGEDASIWCNASLRGDVHSLVVGARTNIQDNCVLHATYERWPLEIGEEVVVGHGAILHGCVVGKRCLIGMRAVVLDGCVIEDEVIVGAGAVVTPGTRIPAGSLALGTPARVVRALSEEQRAELRTEWARYVGYLVEYRRLGHFCGWAAHPCAQHSGK